MIGHGNRRRTDGAKRSRRRRAAEIEEVVVTGIRASLRAVARDQARGGGVVDAITAEDVGKFPDKNLAEALQRVPGVAVNREFGEGERVNMRGMSPNLTRTLFNGHSLATADWFILDQLNTTRSFNYLMLPADIIGQVKVYKSPQADLEEGGIGGTIDVMTRKPLDLESARRSPARCRGRTRNSRTKTIRRPPALFSWKNSDEHLRRADCRRLPEAQHPPRRRRGAGLLRRRSRPAGSLACPSLIGSALFKQERVRKGGNFAVQWRPPTTLDVNLTGLYSKFDADNINENFLAWGSRGDRQRRHADQRDDRRAARRSPARSRR